MKYPAFPQANECIGICAPSAGVGNKIDSFEISLNVLHNHGFKTVETASVRNEGCPSAEPEIRAQEFNELVEDSEVTSILCATGGDFLMEMLPYIKEESIKKSPKWFIGYSDPTSIEIFMTTICDIASIYGVNAGSFDWEELQDFHENALSIISGNIVTQHSYPKYDSMPFSDSDSEDRYRPVDWQLFTHSENGWSKCDYLKITGRLIGGCSDCIDTILGTPYEDFGGFCERYAEDGIVWFFDPFAQDPLQLRQMMVKMKFMGLFENAKLIIFGRVLFPNGHEDEEYIDYLQKVIPGVPFVWGADIGHTKPNMTLINGSVGDIELSAGKATVNMTLV